MWIDFHGVGEDAPDDVTTVLAPVRHKHQHHTYSVAISTQQMYLGLSISTVL